MDMLRKFFLGVCGVSLSVITSILVMINGWGLEPKSWTWIVGVYLAGSIMASFLTALSLAKEPDKTK